MQKVDFIKMHGLGNDFVIIDKRSNNIAITEDIIKRLSDRRTGAVSYTHLTLPTNREV